MPNPAVTLPEFGLTSWRTQKPEYLEKHRDEWRAALLRVTHLESESHRLLLTRAAADDAAPTLAVAGALRRVLGEETDLGWSWVALAAISGGWVHSKVSDMARLAVAARLLELAEDMACDGISRQTVALRELARQWAAPLLLTLASTTPVEVMHRLTTNAAEVLNTVVGEEVKRDAPSALQLAKDPRPVPVEPNLTPQPPAKGTPTLQVVQEIAAVRGDREDKLIVEAWSPLTRPMPLAGGLDPDLLETVLEAEFPWLDGAIQSIVGDLRLRRQAGAGWAHFRPVLLVGPPGTGKTRLARRIAEILGLGYGEINAGGASDNRLLQGTARGWSSASPSLILHVMRRTNVANPVMLVDEVDKVASTSHNGSIHQTLLTMLEPQSAKAWPDDCLMAPCDLSAVNWILAANDATPLRGPLLTRLRVVETGCPGPEHFETVIASLQRDLATELGVSASDLPDLPKAVLGKLKDAFGRGISIRRIKSALEAAVHAGGGVEGGRRLN